MRTTNAKPLLSMKLKLTLWFTMFLTVLAVACLGVILTISGSVAEREAHQTLSLSVRSNLSDVTLEGGNLRLGPDFQFYINDVYMLIYNQNMALLSGQAPPSFPVDTGPENNQVRFVSGVGDDYYVLDFWVPSGWEDGLWLRGVLKSPDSSQTIRNIFIMFAVILPFFILAAAIGGYLIIKNALAPITRITDTAGAISGGQDLTRRIGETGGSLEMHRLAQSFDQMFERLEQSFEAEKRFTSDASHELRTPVSVILAQCSYLRSHGENLEEYREAMGVIERQAGNMSRLIHRLLELTRLDLGTRRLSLEPVNLSEMAEVLCEELDTRRRGISLSASIEENVTVTGDSFLLSQVFTNLLENARKYGREHGHIKLRLSRQKGQAVLEVEDDGIGIPEEEQENIWKRFYQVNTARQSDSGLGLGLSIVRQIAELHGGNVSVKSAPGSGSCFRVVLPLENTQKKENLPT